MDYLVRLLWEGPSRPVTQAAVQAIGNLAADNAGLQDALREAGERCAHLSFPLESLVVALLSVLLPAAHLRTIAGGTSCYSRSILCCGLQPGRAGVTDEQPTDSRCCSPGASLSSDSCSGVAGVVEPLIKLVEAATDTRRRNVEGSGFQVELVQHLLSMQVRGGPDYLSPQALHVIRPNVCRRMSLLSGAT